MRSGTVFLIAALLLSSAWTASSADVVARVFTRLPHKSLSVLPKGFSHPVIANDAPTEAEFRSGFDGRIIVELRGPLKIQSITYRVYAAAEAAEQAQQSFSVMNDPILHIASADRGDNYDVAQTWLRHKPRLHVQCENFSNSAVEHTLWA